MIENRFVFSWAQMKAQIDAKAPAYQHIEDSKSHSVWFIEGPLFYFCGISKDATPSADQIDFETNYKAGVNKPPAVLFEPFAAKTVEFAGDGVVAATISGNGLAQNIDHKMLADRLINGGIVFVSNNASQKDWMKAQVVDKDGLIPAGSARDPYPNYPILTEWITRWGVIPGFPIDLQTPQAGEVPALMWLRIVYKPENDGVERMVTVNYRLNKKL